MSIMTGVVGVFCGPVSDDELDRIVNVVLIKSDEAAHGRGDNASVPPEGTVTFRALDVYEVAHDV